ncbi:MAG: VanZ family protein [Candidatus Krumholzibacteriia bacterium]
MNGVPPPAPPAPAPDRPARRRGLRRWLPPPRLRLRAAGLLLLFLILFFVPLPNEWKRLRWLYIPSDLAHVPLLGLLAWGLAARGPLRGRPWAAAGLTVLVGLGIELVQSVTGRQMSLVDLALDASGAGLAVCWARRRAWPVAALAAALAVSLALPLWHLWPEWDLIAAERLAARRFPLLDDFEARVGMADWRPNHNGRLRRVPRADGGYALSITGAPPAVYPGANLNGFPRDWSGHARLEWDARVADADSVRFIVRLDDFAAREDGAWLAARFTAGRAWRHYVWEPTAALGRQRSRPLQRNDMNGLTIYLARPAVPVTLEIDNLRLQ